MQIHQGIKDLPSFKNAVITIGSFDGVHVGHQKILQRINRLASEIEGESIVITFYPHPRSVIYPKDNSLRLLNTLDEKMELFKNNSVDHVVVVPFSVEFSQQSPSEYLKNFIVKSFDPAYVVIGYDHRYGLNRQGDIHLLKEYAAERGFKVLEIQKQEIEDIAISSTKIRNALNDGNITEANLFLGYPYKLNGKVIHGDKIGKTLGYPTANIEIPEKTKLIPLAGVYAVKVSIDDASHQGMLYIGNRPTINNKNKISLEVNIFDFSEDIYGQNIEIELIDFIRGDIKFDSVEELKEQIDQDKIKTKEVLSFLDSQKKKEIKISICILNYNGLHYLESYLPSVVNACPDEGEIVVIDNASTDESVVFLEDWFPEVKIITLEKNHGFAEGYNRGLQFINSPYWLILNSDVKLEPNSISVLVSKLIADNQIAIVQPTINSIEEPEKFEYAGAAGGLLDKLGYPFCRGRIFDEVEKDHRQYEEEDIDWASGACMLIRSKVFEQLGGFDGSYFAHQEEIDLCWRIKNAGYRIIYTPETKAFHLGGGTLAYGNPRKVYLNFRNNLTTILKNERALNLVWIIPLRLILDGIAGLKFLASGHLSSLWAVIRAHWNIYLHVPTILAKRAYYQKLIKKHAFNSSSTMRRKVFSILFLHYILGKKTYSEIANQ